jgi:hypothetical protein
VVSFVVFKLQALDRRVFNKVDLKMHSLSALVPGLADTQSDQLLMHRSTALIDAEKMPVSCLARALYRRPSRDVVYQQLDSEPHWQSRASALRLFREAAASFHEGRPQARLEPAIISRIARSSMRTRF